MALFQEIGWLRHRRIFTYYIFRNHLISAAICSYLRIWVWLPFISSVVIVSDNLYPFGIWAPPSRSIPTVSGVSVCALRASGSWRQSVDRSYSSFIFQCAISFIVHFFVHLVLLSLYSCVKPKSIRKCTFLCTFLFTNEIFSSKIKLNLKTL